MNRNISIGLFVLMLLLGCGSKSDSVAGGFGSETSTGIILSFVSESDVNKTIEYQIFAKESTPTDGISVKPIKSGTTFSGKADTISLAPGTYTISSVDLSTGKRSISQGISVVKGQNSSVNDTVRVAGKIKLILPDSVRVEDYVIYFEGTNISKKLSQFVFNSLSGKRELIIENVPHYTYTNLSMIDLRTNSSRVISKNIAVQSGQTTLCEVDFTLWPVVKSDGMVTVTFKYPGGIPQTTQGDSVFISLIPWNFTPGDSVSKIRKLLVTGVAGSQTMLDVAYGKYNMVLESRTAKLWKSINYDVINRENIAITDTFVPALNVNVKISSKFSEATTCFIEGTQFSLPLSTVPVVNEYRNITFPTVPRGLVTRIGVVDGSGKVLVFSKVIDFTGAVQNEIVLE